MDRVPIRPDSIVHPERLVQPFVPIDIIAPFYHVSDDDLNDIFADDSDDNLNF